MKVLSNFRMMVMRKAWDLVNQSDISFAQALKDAWALIKLQALKALMKIGSVIVTFKKLNGEITTRIATRNMAMVPVDKHPKHGSRETEYVWALPFYSLTDNAWKSLTAQGIISFSIL